MARISLNPPKALTAPGQGPLRDAIPRRQLAAGRECDRHVTDAEVFEEYRGLMFAVAYRTLGTLITAGGQAVAALTLAVSAGQITAIQLLANPDKPTAIMAGRTLPR